MPQPCELIKDHAAHRWIHPGILGQTKAGHPLCPIHAPDIVSWHGGHLPPASRRFAWAALLRACCACAQGPIKWVCQSSINSESGLPRSLHAAHALPTSKGCWIGRPWKLQGNFDPVAPALFVQRRLEMWTTAVVCARGVKNDSPSMADRACDKSRRCHRISPCVTVVAVVTVAFGGQ